ncbi:MAG: hypothetical protein IPN71_09480 [Fibrobacteres bacterium]|nr:hypothetical protein [Fibrobacterota bacterium]
MPSANRSSRLLATSLAIASTVASSLWARQIPVPSASVLTTAMREAVAGDTLLVAPGAHTGSLSGSGDPGNLPDGKGYFWVGNSGTKQHPIVIVAADAANPPILQGTSLETGYTVHVTGDHVILKNLILQTGNKVVVFDHGSWGLVEDCQLRNSGAELLHVRDSSGHVTINRTDFQNSGNETPNFGEGLYIGTDQARWGAADVPQTSTTAPFWGDKAISEGYDGFDWRVEHTTVTCSYFRDIAAEPIDIKEGTRYTTVTGNVFLGDSTGRKGGSSYFSHVGSFVDQKGVHGTFRGNTFWRGTNDSLADYIAEVKRTFPHVPTDLTPAAHSKPWCDDKVDVDSNTCTASENTVAVSLPADPRPACDLVQFDFHSAPKSSGVRAKAVRSTPPTRLVLNRRLNELEAVTDKGRHISLTGRVSSP